MSYLEISTLEKTKTNRAINIRVPIYLPQKISKKTGAVNGIDYRGLFLEHLITGEAYQVEIIRREDKYYCHITFTLAEKDKVYTGHNGIIGIDTNPDGLALTMIDNKGNYKWHKYLRLVAKLGKEVRRAVLGKAYLYNEDDICRVFEESYEIMDTYSFEESRDAFLQVMDRCLLVEE